jgi:phosphoglycolate phosphatase
MDMNARPAVRCAKCGSLERARVLKLLMDEIDVLKPGTKVLHLAPEGGLASLIKERVGEEFYDARDIDIERYRHVKVTHFDLEKECETLPSNTFDVIIHNHVMEHLSCNVWAVLYHLHRSLKPTGHHIFSIPILKGYYEESLFPIGEEERQRRFGQFDHVRRFGMLDIQKSLGMLFRIPPAYDIVNKFSKQVLDKYNIPDYARTGWSGHSIFVLRKDDLLLK